MSIVEYSGPTNPQEIRKYLMRRTKDEIVWEYLRQWREFGDLEKERDEYKQAAEHYVPVAQALAAHVALLQEYGRRMMDSMDQREAFAVRREFKAALAESPAASLARLKAQWQAEAMDGLADRLEWGVVVDHIRDEAERLRRQAEEDAR